MDGYTERRSGTGQTVIDGDLRRRLMAKIGAPLTASAAPVESAAQLSGIELVADDTFESLVSSVYRAAL
jgi:hypothetical protein